MTSKFHQLCGIALILALTACGGGGGGEKSKQPITPPPNQAPTVTISGENASGGQTVTLTAQATDSDGTIVSYQWSQSSGPTIDLTSASDEQLVFIAPSVSSDTEFTFNVLVTDNDGATATHTITITIEPANQHPYVSIEDVTTAPQQTVEITAQASDVDGEIISYLWTQSSGQAVDLINADQPTVTFTAPEVESSETLVLTLTVEDDDGDTSSADVTITIINGVASFTISGKVASSDQVFANIPVQVHVGTQSYLGETNELGRYQINLFGISDENINALVKIVATGNATNSIFKLVSYSQTAVALYDLAQLNDNNLTEHHVHSLNVSTLSSAAAALMEQMNQSIAIESEEKLNSLAVAFDSSVYHTYVMMLEELAADIDQPTNLPNVITSGTASDIYQVLANQSHAQQLYRELGYDYANSHQQLSELVVNTNTISTEQPQNFPREFHLANEDFQFSSNNTGVATDKPFSWQAMDGFINISLDSISNTSQEFANKYDINGYQRTVYGFLKGYNLRLLFSNNNREEWLVEHVYQYHSEDDINSEQVEIVDKDLMVTTALAKTAQKPAADKISVGEALAITFEHPMPATFTRYDGQTETSIVFALQVMFDSQVDATISFSTFNDDSQKHEIHTEHVSWQIDNNVLRLTNENWLFNIANYGEIGEQTNIATISATNTALDEPKASNTIGRVFDNVPSEQIWQLNDVVGVYQYQTAESRLNPLDQSWYELREDGTLSYFYFRFTGGESAVTSDMIVESPGLWRLIDNKVVVRRFMSFEQSTFNFERCHTDDWEANVTSNCTLWLERNWTVLKGVQAQVGEVSLIKQDTTSYYVWLTDEQRMSFQLADEHALYYASSVLSDFIKLDERPITLPSDYVLIKDR